MKDKKRLEELERRVTNLTERIDRLEQLFVSRKESESSDASDLLQLAIALRKGDRLLPHEHTQMDAMGIIVAELVRPDLDLLHSRINKHKHPTLCVEDGKDFLARQRRQKEAGVYNFEPVPRERPFMATPPVREEMAE